MHAGSNNRSTRRSWGLGTAYPKPTADDLEFRQAARTSTAVADYFTAHDQGLVDDASTED